MVLSISIFFISILLVPFWYRMDARPTPRQIFVCLVSLCGILWSAILALLSLGSYYLDGSFFTVCLIVLGLMTAALLVAACVPHGILRSRIVARSNDIA